MFLSAGRKRTKTGARSHTKTQAQFKRFVRGERVSFPVCMERCYWRVSRCCSRAKGCQDEAITRDFRVVAPSLWNALPGRIRATDSKLWTDSIVYMTPPKMLSLYYCYYPWVLKFSTSTSTSTEESNWTTYLNCIWVYIYVMYVNAYAFSCVFVSWFQ